MLIHYSTQLLLSIACTLSVMLYMESHALKFTNKLFKSSSLKMNFFKIYLVSAVSISIFPYIAGYNATVILSTLFNLFVMLELLLFVHTQNDKKSDLDILRVTVYTQLFFFILFSILLQWYFPLQ